MVFLVEAMKIKEIFFFLRDVEEQRINEKERKGWFEKHIPVDVETGRRNARK